MSSTNFANWNVVIAGVDTAEVTLGDNLKISLNLNRQESTEKYITYLVRDFFTPAHVCICAWVFVLLPATCVIQYTCMSDKY